MIFSSSFFKFLLVGMINTCFGLTIMFICLRIFHMNYWVSTWIGNSIGAAVSYLLNKRYTFHSTIADSAGIIRFIAVIVPCYFISYHFGLTFTSYIYRSFILISNDYVEEVAILAGSIIYTITNYLGQRFFVFAKSQ